MRARSLAWLLIPFLAWLVARRQLDVVEVRGRSMAPALLPGDRLLLRRAPPRVGDIVVAPDPRDGRRELVKRVRTIQRCSVVLRGDNPAFSTDARTFGPTPARDAAWRAVARYWPPRRAGRIPVLVTPVEPEEAGGEPACAVPEALVAGDGAAAAVSPARSRPAAPRPPSR